MAVIIPGQVASRNDSAVGTFVPDGALRFNGGSVNTTKKQTLQRTPGTVGSRSTWTFSAWFRRGYPDSSPLFGCVANNESVIQTYIDMIIMRGTTNNSIAGPKMDWAPMVRDYGNFYHVVMVLDTGNSTDNQRVRYWLNGSREIVINTTYNTTNWPGQHYQGGINSNAQHEIGGRGDNASVWYDGLISQVNFIDGQALDASYFGYTDELTGVWRPKKYANTTASPGDKAGVVGYGTCGFYLPFDGSAPIGKDQSGQGNDWTPFNFGGSVPLDRATGALPILNTQSGGKVATVGVRTDSNSTNLVLAVPMVGIASDKSQQINSGTSAKTLTNTTVEFKSTTGAARAGDANFYGNCGDFTGAATDCINTADSADFRMEEGDFTVECWVYSTSTSGTQNICQILGDSSSKYYGIYYSSSALKFYITGTGGAGEVSAGDQIMGKKNWHHVALTRTGGKMRGFIDGVKHVEASDSCDIDESGYQAYIGRHAPTTNGFEGYIQDFRIYKGVAKYTDDFLVASPNPDVQQMVPAGTSYGQKLIAPALSPPHGCVAFDGDDYLTIGDGSTTDLEFGTGDYTVEMWIYPTKLQSNRCFFDLRNNTGGGPVNGFSIVSNGDGLCSTYCGGYVIQSKDYLANFKWTHVEVTRTGGNEYLFLDGILQGVAATSRTYDYGRVRLGSDAASGPSEYWEGLISQVRMIKGTCLHTASFTPSIEPLTSVTNTKLLCCQGGDAATGAVLPSGVSISVSGNPTAEKINPFITESNIDVQRTSPSTYPTMSVLDKNAGVWILDANLSTVVETGFKLALSTVFVDSGKYYWEVYVNNGGSGYVGVSDADDAKDNRGGGNATSCTIATSDGDKRINGSDSSYGIAVQDGSTMMFALDMDNNSLWAGKDGIWFNGGKPKTLENAATTALTKPVSPSISNYDDEKYTINFGQNPFLYVPPDGFTTLTYQNITKSSYQRPDQVVGVATYSGNGSSQCVSFDFQPDLMWVKRLDATNYNIWTDSISGASNYFSTNETDQMSTGGGSQLINGFTADGFTVGNENAVNNSSGTYVSWGWKAGGRKGTWNLNGEDAGSAAAAGLTAGDTSVLTAATINTDAGFSIVKWTQDSGGAAKNIAHGLTQAPNFVIMKHVNSASAWFVTHTAIDTVGGGSAAKIIYLNTAGEEDTSSDFGNAFPGATYTATSTTGVSGRIVIMYSWHDVPGLQKFGGYTGVASTKFVYLGFRPAMLAIKFIDGTDIGSHGGWKLIDDKRDPYISGKVAKKVEWNTDGAQNNGSTTSTSEGIVDFDATGFIIRDNHSPFNTAGRAYAYCAWSNGATNPLYGAQASAMLPRA